MAGPTERPWGPMGPPWGEAPHHAGTLWALVDIGCLDYGSWGVWAVGRMCVGDRMPGLTSQVSGLEVGCLV